MSNQPAAKSASQAPAANGSCPGASDPPRWATNSTFDQLATDLRRAKTVVVTTHAKPDGDAAGSTLAMARSLKHAGVLAEIWYAGPLPRWVPDLFGSTPFRTFAPGQPMQIADSRPAPSLDADLCVIVDTGSWTQLAEMRPWLEPRSDLNINLDHHLHGDGAAATRRIIDSTCASCTQVIAALCVKLCGVPSAAKLPLDVAEPLYLGLAADTGWFRYSSVTPATLRLAADLIEAGVDHTKLYRLIEQQDVASRWRLLGRALNTLELHSVRSNEDTATMSLTLADFEATGAERNDTAGFADMVLTVASVQVAAVLTENPVNPGEPPLTKFSLRSKPGPNAIDVNKVCQKLGGGGHARAAGAKARLELAAAKQAILEALK